MANTFWQITCKWHSLVLYSIGYTESNKLKFPNAIWMRIIEI